ncbi:hypothetical protein [Candidatus Methylacidithermus pantelleriae]|uniref:Uncharacterized protein n=1 Tax=Candidatus Methylacidithermus pantelleriae TaxID=2744239 RepID=A0A8J2BQJ3_9BACT|nr:hypothetical protein [Candidatus Methylacidithermus pantelleriae]CAF0703780.1 hypothetical protein MPNT_60100 [Candidatus Methylacidithermus pantelleriae]
MGWRIGFLRRNIFYGKRRREPKERRSRWGLLFGQGRREFRPEDGQAAFLGQNARSRHLLLELADHLSALPNPAP